MIRVCDIAKAIEEFAPLSLQESYDNAGLQVGNPEMGVSAILFCLDVTEEILREAEKRQCNMIVSHHPLIFKGLKQITGANTTQRIVIQALQKKIAIYSAHTNLDSTFEGVSYEMAHKLEMKNLRPLCPAGDSDSTGLGIVGEVTPTPKLEFLRKVKETFHVQGLRYSGQSPRLVVRKVALCGGSGASMIADAAASGADIYLTGDLKYHDFTTWSEQLLLADIGHYESERCCRNIFARIILEKYPDCVTYMSDDEVNPVKYL